MGFPVYKVLGNNSRVTIGYRGTLSMINEAANLLMNNLILILFPQVKEGQNPFKFRKGNDIRRWKVAFATTDGVNVDEHFGRAGMFAVYELTNDGYKFLEMRKFADGRDSAIEETKGLGQVHDDRVRSKVDKLADCKIVYLTEIGGPSAARLVRKGIMPIKVKEVVSIEESLRMLLETVKKSPPPWLKKGSKWRLAVSHQLSAKADLLREYLIYFLTNSY